MTEQPVEQVNQSVAEVEPTGVAEVDEVLDSVDVLADRPLGEHVAVFEEAHDRLRRALDATAEA
ncbi:MAG: hypothetical protein QM638_16695 [Nocardioides sp.]|uniref:hypothetical protein n=1 Tax=Nocardioides sp. TaxID=35761 RepID=UPI0039E531F3